MNKTALITVAAMTIIPLTARAATWTWDGSEGNDNWTNSPNWTPAVPALVNDGTADIVFGGTTRLTPNLNVLWSVNSVTFNNTAGAFDLGSSNGSILIIGAGGITNNDGDTQLINHAITLFAPQTWNAASGALFFSDLAPIQNNGHLLTVDGGFGTFINGTSKAAAG